MATAHTSVARLGQAFLAPSVTALVWRTGKAGVARHSPAIPQRTGKPMRDQCGARTRSGAPGRAPKVAGKNRCRMHGGAAGSGVPKGERAIHMRGRRRASSRAGLAPFGSRYARGACQTCRDTSRPIVHPRFHVCKHCWPKLLAGSVPRQLGRARQRGPSTLLLSAGRLLDD